MRVHLFHWYVRYIVIILEEEKPLPTTVPLSRNAGDLVSTEQAAPRQQPVNQGGGEEDRTDGGRGYVGYYIEVLLGLHNND